MRIIDALKAGMINVGDILQIETVNEKWKTQMNIIVRVKRVTKTSIETTDINVIRGNKTNNSRGDRGFHDVSMKMFGCEHLNKDDYPEYFI